MERKRAHAQAEVSSKVEAAKSITFDQCAAAYIKAHKAGWRNLKHASQWRNTIATYASPVFGSRSVSAIDTRLVVEVLEPIWTLKPDTASRLRGRIESILDWAHARGYREGENPARWKGKLSFLLPRLPLTSATEGPCGPPLCRHGLSGASRLHAPTRRARRCRRACLGVHDSDGGKNRRSAWRTVA